MSTPKVPTGEQIPTESLEASEPAETRTLEGGPAVQLSEEEFKLLNSVESTDPAWQGFLAVNGLKEGALYEFHIVDDEGNERVGVYTTDPNDHLTRDPVLTAQVEERIAASNQSEQEGGEISPESHEALLEDASEDLGVVSVKNSVEAEPIPERLVSSDDMELVHSIVDDISRMARAHQQMAAEGGERQASARQNDLVAQLAQSVIDRFDDGKVGEEANAFLMGAAMGALKDGPTMHAIYDRIERTGKVSQAELDVIKSNMQLLEEQSRMNAEQRAAALHQLDLQMSTMLEKNGQTPDKATLTLSGMIAGVSTQLSPQDYSYGDSRRSAAVSDLGRLQR